MKASPVATNGVRPLVVCHSIYSYGIGGEGNSATHRAEAFMSQKRLDVTKIHTNTFAHPCPQVRPERVEDAIKVLVKTKGVVSRRAAAE
jgi:L-iditol 2-dehydrogenase